MMDLDVTKLRKIRALMDEGATAGERAAAKASAEKIAKRAGLTLDQALSKLDEKPNRPQAFNFFDGFDDWMETREPGHKARAAAERRERERNRLEKCTELLRRYGSEDAVFAETNHELRLRETLEPLADRSTYSNCDKTYISGYAGWTCQKPPPVLWEALARAIPFPTDLTGVWFEYQAWRNLSNDRIAFNPDYSSDRHVYAREAALEALLDEMSDPTVEGIRIRLNWMRKLNDREFSRDVKEDVALTEALASDFESFVQSIQLGHVQNGQISSPMRRTNAEKQADIAAALREYPGLSDREIACRVGVSPQSVNTWRKRLGV